MPLIPCPVCTNHISVEAAACPRCGHPNRPDEPLSDQRACYSCDAAATTRCESCGIGSCREHLSLTTVYYGKRREEEFRCADCAKLAVGWRTFEGLLIFVFVFVMIVLIAASR